MKSLTKANVEKKQVEAAVKKCFNQGMKEYGELNDGYYNISYLVVLDDGREAVLKIAPPKDVEILTYEKDIIETELKFYKLAFEYTDLNVPEVLAEDLSCEVISSPYYFMSKIEGKPLNKVKNITSHMRRTVNTSMAEYMAKLHNIKGEIYGYITMADKCEGKDCLNSLIVSVDALLYDAHRKNMRLPFKERNIYKVFNSCQKAFDEIEYPVVCHYDLWDGNIFVEEMEDGLNVTGAIDFERGFYGCPAADFCQLDNNIDFADAQYFFDEYNRHADKKMEYTPALRVRILAYKFYVYLIMFVECDYRDINGSFLPQKLWVKSKIRGLYRELKKGIRELD